MSEREEIRKQIDEARDDRWVETRLKAAPALAKSRHEALERALQPPRLEDPGRFRRANEAAAKMFQGLDPADLASLMPHLFPRLAAPLGSLWQTSLPVHRCSPWFLHEGFPFRVRPESPIAAPDFAQAALGICHMFRGLDPDAEWVAAYAPHLGGLSFRPILVGRLLGAALRSGGDEAERVRRVLVDSISGEHAIGVMGAHAIVALLDSDDRGDWEVVGRLLLAAQRQEGLRQSILEAAHLGGEGAFRYLLGLILEHNLGRFSAVVRAFDMWLGTRWAGGSARVVQEGVTRLCTCFDDEEALRGSLAAGGGEEAYFALWVLGFRDGEAAVEAAATMLADPEPERRAAALRILQGCGLPGLSRACIVERIISGGEPDPRLQMALCRTLTYFEFESVEPGLFDATLAIFDAAPARPQPLGPLLWPWWVETHDRGMVGGALRQLAVGQPGRLVPIAAALESSDCVSVISELAGLREPRLYSEQKPRRKKLTPEARALMLGLTADARQPVHSAALKALDLGPVGEDEIEQYCSLLHRKAGTLRKAVIGRLVQLPAERALEVVDRLLASGDPKKAAAGLEIAAQYVESSPGAVRAVVSRHQELLRHGELADISDQLLGGKSKDATLEDCFGLAPPASLSPLVEVRRTGVAIETKAALACLNDLVELIIQHGETEVEIEGGDLGDEGRTRALLANAVHLFPEPKPGSDIREDARARLPLWEVWTEWLEGRSKKLRDTDNLEIVRLWALRRDFSAWESTLRGSVRAAVDSQLGWGLSGLLSWLVRLSNPEGGTDLLFRYMEDGLADDLAGRTETRGHRESAFAERYSLCRGFVCLTGSTITVQQAERLPRLVLVAVAHGTRLWGEPRDIETFLPAYDAGLLHAGDFTWMLLHAKESEDNWGLRYRFGPIREACTFRTPTGLAARPELAAAARRVRERLVELELVRGERTTPASHAAAMLPYSGGATELFALIAALGRDKILRHHEHSDPTRVGSLSRLLFATRPGGLDTAEEFGRLLRASGVGGARMLEVAMFAPQWASRIEGAMGKKGLAEAVWWIHAHTKSRASWEECEARDLWSAQVAERTELDAEELEDGAVDVAWFGRVLALIGEEGWEQYLKPAKYASKSGGHKRAELFARAMLGRVQVEELLGRIGRSRHQDSVRALGLVPLPADAADAKAETLRRYLLLQEFKRGSRKFGSQRQASEGRAVEIGMANLARTAGYRDPRRLQWAMESAAVADLARGPVEISVDGTTLSLSITGAGEPELVALKAGKTLKTIPSRLGKDDAVKQIRARVSDLRRQTSRMRLSLEESMCRGDAFSGPELRELFEHPMLRPMLERLVFIGEGGLVGYPSEGGRVLLSHSGAVEPVGGMDSVRIAHPLDLLARKDWHAWQRECLRAERVQPFKQVFREVYPKTGVEVGGCDLSRRYAGHQVNPRQALSLLKARQWVLDPGEGVRKRFHDEGLTAELWFQEPFFTPADIEGLTLEGVAFQRHRDSERIAMSGVPDRVFSETMRDLDLVVSVAHLGGVDPEASASTVEMRAALLRETCQLLGLSNVRVEGHHAIVDGTLATYSLHLGSATTRVMPGRVLVIVAVHSQYRGRLFLPFADNDPKTAEVMAKALLLARDDEILDPSILEQIRG
ncbi:MAG: DUF4132 domain-containing protein [Phycisphaerales bacterium]|nr:DUF4132 domain-containing protein [Phycisphaerales bacterium]